MFLWLQKDTSSLRLFSIASSGRQMIRNFSVRQRLRLLLELLYGECDERMLSSVEFLCLATLNTETPPNSASISGPSKTTTSNTIFPGAFSL